MNIYDNIIVDKEHILTVHNNNNYNKVIKDYYIRFKETHYLSESRVGRLEMCNKFWTIDKYDYNQIKDFTGTVLCKDKFCNNCKKVKQAARMSKYIPYLQVYGDKLYHLTLTLPNVVGEELRYTIKDMAIAFRKLIRFLACDKKIHGIDFSQYGYLGAVRSLEITFNENDYHPHYHVAIAFSNLDLKKTIENKYSIDYTGRRETRLFSEFEILIQKIWYLLLNNEEVNKRNIDKLECGYSCIIDKLQPDDYAEFFKYMIKETDETDNILSYENFKTLYLATEYLRQIQGYGCFYMITDKDLDEEVDKIYLEIKDILLNDEVPEVISQTPLELLNDINFKLISRKKIYQYIRQIKENK